MGAVGCDKTICRREDKGATGCWRDQETVAPRRRQEAELQVAEVKMTLRVPEEERGWTGRRIRGTEGHLRGFRGKARAEKAALGHRPQNQSQSVPVLHLGRDGPSNSCDKPSVVAGKGEESRGRLRGEQQHR